MRQSFHVRLGVEEDAGRLAVLATQVRLHTYATDGISTEIAEYVLAHITPETYAQLLRDASTHVLVATHANHGLCWLSRGSVISTATRVRFTAIWARSF
jgi:hypothetical protein